MNEEVQLSLVSPKLSSGQDIFDSIMGNIEPELMSGAAEDVAEIYRDETPEQNAARMARYQAAFVEYDAQYKEYVEKTNVEVNTYRQQALRLAEASSRAEDDVELQSLEASFA